MTYIEANKLLNDRKEGAAMSIFAIDEALRATGDLEPHKVPYHFDIVRTWSAADAQPSEN